MPAKSKAQQRLMGVAYAVKKGDMQLSDVDASYKDEVKDLVDNMSLKSLKKYAATKHDGLPERVPENIQVGQINGMGPVELPADGLLGSGDVPAGRGDAEEEYKKKKKKMTNFEEFINGLNQSKVDEAYGGNASDFKYEFTNQFEDVTGFSDKAIKGIKKKGKNSYEVRTSTYAGKEYMEAVGKQMGLELKKFEKHSNMCISVYESKITEAKAEKYDNVDIQNAWSDAFGRKYDIMDEFPDVIDDVLNDYKDKATIQDLYDIWDDRYGQEPPQEFIDVLGESAVTEIRMSAWGELVYTEDQVNTQYGWCGTLAQELGEDKAMFLTHQSIHDLQKRAMGLTAWEALAILNSKAGRHAAEAFLGKESGASDALSALIWYFGSKSKLAKAAKEERELQFPSEK